jgi:tetratricopeptide (TPR) repeat protein
MPLIPALTLLSLLLNAPPLPAAAPEPGVVQLDASGPGAAADDDRAAVEDARGTTGLARALEGYLALHPHGRAASRALREEAALPDDLAESAALLRRAREEGADYEEGSAAALDLARLEYAQGRPDSALLALERSDAWPRPASLQAEWLYWRAQCHLAQKGFRQAREDLRRLLTLHPDSPRAEAALAARADCDAHCHDDAAAEEAWARLVQGKGAFAAQALWGLADLRQRQGRREEARRLFQRLADAYPASFEAQAAGGRLEALAKAPAGRPVAPPPPLRRHWWVQVGAYSRQAKAQQLVHALKARRWKAMARPRTVDGQPYYFVTVGPYANKAKAQAAAQRLHAREKLESFLVEE